MRFQPKLPPFVMMSTSSQLSWPTSPANRRPVPRSNEKRQGLRSPYAQISGKAPPLTNGLSGGIAYCLSREFDHTLNQLEAFTADTARLAESAVDPGQSLLLIAVHCQLRGMRFFFLGPGVHN